MKKNRLMNIFLFIFLFYILFGNNFIQNENQLDLELEKQNIQLNVQIPQNSDYSIVADHSIVNLIRNDIIPESAIILAKQLLHIVYGHTSHGSQLTTGMTD